MGVYRRHRFLLFIKDQVLGQSLVYNVNQECRQMIESKVSKESDGDDKYWTY